MNIKATATLTNSSKISGRLTTDHSASSYGQPVFVDNNNQAINWADIIDISTAPAIGKSGGIVKSEKKSRSSAENGRKGGRPKKL